MRTTTLVCTACLVAGLMTCPLNLLFAKASPDAAAPKINSASADFSVKPAQLTISRSGFGKSIPTVNVDSPAAGVISNTNTTIVASLPLTVTAGSYLLQVTNTTSNQTISFDATLGTVGPEGPAGPAGAPGATRPQGPEGSPGAAEPQGPAGLTGATGPQGPTGPTGAIGPQGLTGPIGSQGLPGLPGPQGSQGPQGPAGMSFNPGGWTINSYTCDEGFNVATQSLHRL